MEEMWESLASLVRSINQDGEQYTYNEELDGGMRIWTEWCLLHDVVCEDLDMLDTKYEGHDWQSTSAFENKLNIEISLDFSIELAKTTRINSTAKFAPRSGNLLKQDKK